MTFDSTKYWTTRYATGGTSGAGSTGRLARYKAEFINGIVRHNAIQAVIEFGSGDGQQLSLFDVPFYIGIDVVEDIVRRLREAFPDETRYQFLSAANLAQARQCELAISLDVIFHLVEDDIFEKYMRNLFLFSTKWVAIYSSDYDGDWPDKHVRHRNITSFVERRHPEWRMVAKVTNPYPWNIRNVDNTSFADFLIFARRSLPQPLLLPVPAHETEVGT